MSRALLSAIMTSEKTLEKLENVISFAIRRRVNCTVTPSTWSRRSADSIKWKPDMSLSSKNEFLRMPGKRILCDRAHFPNSDAWGSHQHLLVQSKLPASYRSSMIGKDISKLVDIPAYRVSGCKIKSIQDNKHSSLIELRGSYLSLPEIYVLAKEMEKEIKKADR